MQGNGLRYAVFRYGYSVTDSSGINRRLMIRPLLSRISGLWDQGYFITVKILQDMIFSFNQSHEVVMRLLSAWFVGSLCAEHSVVTAETSRSCLT